MSYYEPDKQMEAAFARLERHAELAGKTDLDSQIEYIQISVDSGLFHPIADAVLASLKKLKTLTPSASNAIVPEMDTYDPTAIWDGNPPRQCVGRCNVAGVCHSVCMACGWSNEESFNNQ